MKISHILPVTVAVLLLIAMLFTTGWDHPPLQSEQMGYRGLGMVSINSPEAIAAKMAANQPPVATPPLPAEGPKASETYQNVQVLGDLSIGQFNRLMVAMTSWIAPEQGCNYCHLAEDLASDDVYTKVVSRRMLEMTKHINIERKTHVADTGVTCYTCHRGQPVPEHIWFKDDGPKQAQGMAASRDGQNIASATVGYTSLPGDPFSPFLNQSGNIRVVSTTALPAGNPQDIKKTEWTYGLMMHLSQALGVNCTYCHNSRSFFAWDQSSPQRVTAWHGLQMVSELNQSYLEPLTDVFPANRLGPQGDVPKINCGTCHQGAAKPLNGASMLADYPELATATMSMDAAATDDSATEAADTEAADTEAADTEAADTEAADTEAADTEAADTEAADTEAADTEAADTEAEAEDAEATDDTDGAATEEAPADESGASTTEN